MLVGQVVTAFLKVFGPCRVLCASTPDELLIHLLQAGCDTRAVDSHPGQHLRCLLDLAYPIEAGPFDAIIFALKPSSDLVADLGMLTDRFGSINDLMLLAGGCDRRRLEGDLFKHGWRRHPSGLDIPGYGELRDDRLADISIYQRIPAAAAARWPVEALLADRPLHMDMLRESGCRADAHIVRYAFAARYIRRGDTVLDCACGLGYGTAVMASISKASALIGVDCEAGTVEYALANYARPGVSFRVGDAASLTGIPDGSVDVVVSMETLEHVSDWEAAVQAFRRVLKPDGRLIASVPDRWCDETGNDPNPYHVQVFDWERLSRGVQDGFILEERWIQTAPGGFKLPNAGRVLRQVDLNATLDAEWLLVVASANPFAATEEQCRAYVHPAFDRALAVSGATVVDFRNGYDNPFLYRMLVQMGERLTDDTKLVRLAEWVADHARQDSADQGAGLCVLAYRILEGRGFRAVHNLMCRIQDYFDGTAETPNAHVARWRISLAVVAGRLCELTGDLDDALWWYMTAANLDWRVFSPLLATKAVSAAFLAGRMLLARGDVAAARKLFALGLDQALEAVRADARNVVGDPAEPIVFGLPELAEVADMGSQCANAIAALPLWERDRGLFWRGVDVKRFGLASWCRNLERINKQLEDQLRLTLRKNDDLQRAVTAANWSGQ